MLLLLDVSQCAQGAADSHDSQHFRMDKTGPEGCSIHPCLHHQREVRKEREVEEVRGYVE